MKLKLTDSTSLFEKQLRLMESTGLIALAKDGVPFSVTESEQFKVTLTESAACVYYTRLSEIFKGAFMLATADKAFEKSLTARFSLCGEMVDNSRNAVMTVKHVCEHIALSAAFGLNCIYLYNEDTFEIEGEPYFGYMRGRYSREEMKAISDCAAAFGLELIPCIQTLAHHNQTLRWACYAPIRDLGDTLLVGDERTYALIDRMLASWRAVTDGQYINIGMDEAYYMGRGKGLDRDGAVDRFKLLCEHLTRVVELCRKYDFTPMMWSDMFFRIAFGGYYGDGEMAKALTDIIPEGVSLIYWDYYTTEQAKYARQIERHQQLGTPTVFAGGAWKWSGFTPAIDHSWRVSVMALDEVLSHGIDQAMLTCWGDDGADCLSDCVLPLMSLYGAYNYPDGDIEATAKKQLFDACGYSLDDFYALSAPRITPTGNTTPYANPTKYLLYNDVLKGMFDRHVGEGFGAYYGEQAATLATLAKRDSRYAYLFEVQSALCSVLELKSELGVRLKAAYDACDRTALESILKSDIPETICRLDTFLNKFRSAWRTESKPEGFDTQDIRIGGVMMRLRAAALALWDYLEGKTESIPELEAERLYFDCRGDDSTANQTVGMNGYLRNATANIL